MKQLELFSGIGGFRRALDLLERDFSVKFQTIAYSEIDKYASNTYKAAFSKDSLEIGDIISFNKDENNISQLPNFELVTGGFPCQPFSMMGAQNGFNDSRGGLFFEIIKILKIKRPKFVLLENVRNLITHDKGKTIKRITDELESCGYHVFYDVFNTSNFGLAQTRNRVYIFATTLETANFSFNSTEIQKVYETKLKGKCSLLYQKNTHEILEKKVDDKFYLSEKIKPTILANGSKNYIVDSSINPLIARPLTATMVKLHRACQDNYFSDGFIKSKDPYDYVKINFSKEELSKQRIRKLTPKEAFMLQGFDDDYFSKIQKSGTSQAQLYKEAGNAVSVNTVYAICYYIFIHCGFERR